MSYAVLPTRTTFRHNYFAFLFSCTFIFGFVFGAFVALRNASYYVLLIRSAAVRPVSAVWAIIHIFSLLVVTALIYRSKRQHLIFAICFLHAFTFGIARTSVFFSYRSAHWLVSAIMLFSKTVMMILWLWFCFRNFPARSQTAQRDFIFTFFASVLGAVLDIYLVSPYLLMLFA